MSRKPTQLDVELKIEYIPMPQEHVEVWRAGLDLVLELIRAEVANERLGIGCNSDPYLIIDLDGHAFIENSVFQGNV